MSSYVLRRVRNYHVEALIFCNRVHIRKTYAIAYVAMRGVLTSNGFVDASLFSRFILERRQCFPLKTASLRSFIKKQAGPKSYQVVLCWVLALLKMEDIAAVSILLLHYCRWREKIIL